MPRLDKRAELARRDIVARAIDHEMKRLANNSLLEDLVYSAPAARDIAGSPAPDPHAQAPERVLEDPALWMQESRPEAGLVAESALRRRLAEVFADALDREARRDDFMDQMRARAAIELFASRRGRPSHGMTPPSVAELHSGVEAISSVARRVLAHQAAGATGPIPDVCAAAPRRMATSLRRSVQSRAEPSTSNKYPRTRPRREYPSREE